MRRPSRPGAYGCLGGREGQPVRRAERQHSLGPCRCSCRPRWKYGCRSTSISIARRSRSTGPCSMPLRSECCTPTTPSSINAHSTRWHRCPISTRSSSTRNRLAATSGLHGPALNRPRPQRRWVQMPPNQQLGRHLHSTPRVNRLVCPRRPRRHVTTMTEQTLPENGPIGLFSFQGQKCADRWITGARDGTGRRPRCPGRVLGTGHRRE